MRTSYVYKISNIKKLEYFPNKNVRWLNISKDYDMIKEYFKLFDADIESRELNSMYFGTYVYDYDDSEKSKGKMCAFVENNEILSFATVMFISKNTYELCAGSTNPLHLCKGYSKSVCSFIAKYVLENNKKLICETNKENLAAQKLLRGIGMRKTILNSR